jgi:hypothetical protein
MQQSQLARLSAVAEHTLQVPKLQAHPLCRGKWLLRHVRLNLGHVYCLASCTLVVGMVAPVLRDIKCQCQRCAGQVHLKPRTYSRLPDPSACSSSKAVLQWRQSFLAGW